MNTLRLSAIVKTPLAGNALLALLYFGAAQAGLWLAFSGSNASPVWPASGLAFAAMYRWGPAMGPGVWLGAFAANLTTFTMSGQLPAGSIWPASALIAAGNLAEAWLASALCRRHAPERLFGTTQGAYLFTAAALLGAAASASCGAGALLAFGIVDGPLGSIVLATWWLGDVVGLLVVAPLLLIGAPGRHGVVSWGRMLPTAALFTVSGLLVFGGLLSAGHADRLASVLLLVVVACSAVRHGSTGAVTATFGVALWAVVATLLGLGPFAKATVNDSLISLDVFLALCAVTGMMVAASVPGRTQADRGERAWRLPVAMLLAGLAGTIGAWHLVARNTEREAVQKLDVLASLQRARILERLRLYEQALRGARGLFDASSEVDGFEWHRYIESLDLEDSYPGVQALGFAERLTPVASAERTRIVYTEPLNDRNRRALGFDMASEPVRRLAMELARDNGRTALSGRVTLRQEDGHDMQHGVLMYLPVYRSGMPVSTEQERRDALHGWVYGAFRMGDLMHAILGPGDLDMVRLTLYDGDAVDADRVLFDSAAGRSRSAYAHQRTATRELALGEHRWLAAWTTTPRFDASVDTTKAQTVLVAGALISLLLFTMVRSLSNMRQQALALAERMRAAHAEAEDRFRSLAESANAAMLVIDDRGVVEFCNGASTRLFGRPAHVLQGVRLDELLGSNGALSVAQDQLAIGHAPPAFEAVAMRPDSETPVEISLGSWMRDGRRYFSAIVLDISARRRAELQVRRSRADLRAILDNMPAMVGSWDAEQCNRFCNKEYYDWFGTDPEHAQGHPIREVIGERLYHEELLHIEKVLKGGHVSFERLITNPAGRTRHVQTHYIPDLRDGVVQGFFVLMFDMTRHKEVEQALEYGLRLHDVIFTHAGVGIACTRERRFERVSRRFTELLGYEQGELDGAPAASIFTDEASYAEVGALARELMPSGQTLDHELFLKRKDGATLWCRLMGRAVEPGDASQGTIWIVDDFSDRKQREMLLETARESAESAARLKAQFLANMSHEIRTPMNAIIGMTRLTLDSPLDPMQRDNLQNVYDSAASLLRLLNDILDFSKMEAGKMELVEEEFDLRERLAVTLQSFAPAAAEKGLDLVLDVTPDAAVLWRGDGGRLMQVVTNLLSNAVKFTRVGHVACRVEIERRQNEACGLLFTIADTGVGIPSEQCQRVFDSFVQADSSITRQYGGTGLGLAICAQIVGLMQGRIWLDSEPGVGSTFHFTVMLQPSSSPPELPAAQRAALKDRAVLLAIGNHASRAATARLLRAWSMRVVECQAAAALLSAARLGAHHGAAYAAAIVDAPTWEALQRIDPSQFPAGLEVIRLNGPGEGNGLRQPLRHEELSSALLRAVGARPANDADLALPGPTTTPGKPAGAPLRILAAEDHPVNQKLVERILSLHGHHVTVVGDGKQAVEAARHARFDVILMDMQMPEMDGIAATRAIREFEQAEGRRTPVIAVTAHAMHGERERLLAAGLDDYLSKPFVPEHLCSVVARWAPDAAWAPPAAASTAAAAVPGEAVCDLHKALEGALGDEALLHEMVGMLLAELPGLLEDVRTSLEAGDLQKTARAAHRLRGAAGNFHAQATMAAAHALEEACTSADRASTSACMGRLERETARLAQVFGQWIAKEQA
nr:CHASE domain-containing protein [uncultured Caldimonas sp.]